METDRLQVAVWFLLPIIGLIALMVVIGFRGGVFILPPIIVVIGLVLALAWMSNQRKA